MLENKMNIICILGGPGAGKTTLSTTLLNKIPNSIVLKSGSLIRSSLNNYDNNESKKVSFVMDQGGLVDDKFVCKILKDEIEKLSAKGSVHNIILDGYPRSLKQLLSFDHLQVTLCGVIILEAPELILEKRCKIRNLRTDRIDDLQQPVAERVQDFRTHIGEILSEVEKRSIKYLKISTCGSAEDTSQHAVTFALQLNL